MSLITRLVPDLGDELVGSLLRIEETLASLDDGRTGLPAPLADGVALAAARRLELALTASQSRAHWPPPQGGHILGPDGLRMRPLHQVVLDTDDLAVLTSTAQILGYEIAARPTSELASSTAAATAFVWPVEDGMSPSITLVTTLTRLLGLLDLADTTDVATLAARLAAAGAEPIVLDDAGSRAYARLTARMDMFWPPRHPPCIP